MSNRPALRFDTREIAVLFSLFVFVSLLMFTVGILVGKGLTQARYEGKLPGAISSKMGEPLVKTFPEHHAGASVSLGDAHDSRAKPQAHTQNHTENTDSAAHAPAAHGADTAHKAEATPPTVAAKPEAPLKLIPLKTPSAQTNGIQLSDPIKTEAAELLKNPKIRSLVDTEPEARTPASKGPAQKEKYTVQVGSYPNEQAAQERVEALKRIGYSSAYFTAKELGSTAGTWYRVWLGLYPDYTAAKKMGDELQTKGEVKNYIVRKSD